MWFHKMRLPDGTITPGRADCEALLPVFGITPDLFAGKSVLDIGCNDGFYSFYAERSGARRVVALDNYAQHPDGLDNFRLARTAFGLGVELVIADIQEGVPAELGTFDVVLFMRVFYHLSDPWRGLRNAIAAVGERLVVESHIDRWAGERYPAMRFYPNGEVDGDRTTLWGPNVTLFMELLQKRFGSVASKLIAENRRVVIHASSPRA